MIIAAVDSSDEQEIAERYGVEAYPTFKVFIKGEAFEYQGKREKQSMIDFNNEVSTALLLISPKIKDIPKPFVAITGID